MPRIAAAKRKNAGRLRTRRSRMPDVVHELAVTRELTAEPGGVGDRSRARGGRAPAVSPASIAARDRASGGGGRISASHSRRHVSRSRRGTTTATARTPRAPSATTNGGAAPWRSGAAQWPARGRRRPRIGKRARALRRRAQRPGREHVVAARRPLLLLRDARRLPSRRRQPVLLEPAQIGYTVPLGSPVASRMSKPCRLPRASASRTRAVAVDRRDIERILPM